MLAHSGSQIDELRLQLIAAQDSQRPRSASNDFSAERSRYELQIGELQRQLTAAQNGLSDSTNQPMPDFSVESARYEREITDLRSLLSEARSEKFGQAVAMNKEGGGSSTYNPGAYFRDRHRIHHINVGGDMRFA